MELAKPFNMSQPAISTHLEVLEKAGLISQSTAAQTRPRKLEPFANRAGGMAQKTIGYELLYPCLYDLVAGV
jgi:predicted ArsR family transcriptional regulator